MGFLNESEGCPCTIANDRRGVVMRVLAYLTAAACAVAATAAGAQTRPAGDLLVLAATTSVEDSGLFDSLVPRFRASSGIDIHVVSRASSTALTTAEHGTIDVVIVNDPEALDRFVAAGDGARPSPLHVEPVRHRRSAI